MLKPTWELNSEERIALAEHRCDFLFRHIKETGGSPKRSISPTTILLQTSDHVFSVAISKQEPRHVTVSLAYSSPPIDEQTAVAAAQLASQSTIVAKVRVEPRDDELRFSVEASFFNDDEEDLTRTLGLYLAAIQDTYERFLDELIKQP